MVFLILVVIQFIVVTKGAERVAEVGARFTLDAMPGKQMAIDADLNAGLITEEQARARRAEVSAEADFYGAMDGASKFVKGDAIAGILIIVINVVGGIAIGMIQRGMELGDAINSYTLLTIGDGLVSQIPALLMAVSTGMIVTRSNAEIGHGHDREQPAEPVAQRPDDRRMRGHRDGADPRNAAHPVRAGRRVPHLRVAADQDVAGRRRRRRRRRRTRSPPRRRPRRPKT